MSNETVKEHIPFRNVEGALPLLIAGFAFNIVLMWYGYASLITWSLGTLAFFIIYVLGLVFAYYFSLSAWNNVFDRNIKNNYLIPIMFTLSIFIPLIAFELATTFTISLAGLWETFLLNYWQMVIYLVIPFLVMLSGFR